MEHGVGEPNENPRPIQEVAAAAEEEEEDGEELGARQLQQQQLLENHRPPENGILRRHDSFDAESSVLAGGGGHGLEDKSWGTILVLAFQSLGIVYGDIGTSPLYVFASTFTDGIRHRDDILGVLSVILYTLTLIPLLKYVLVVLQANDNGNGGTFALYSLICRYTKLGLIPSQQTEDREVSNFQWDIPHHRRSMRALKWQAALERRSFAKHFLLFATTVGTAMVIGDGVLTPCVSVLSAVGGLKEATHKMNDGKIALVSSAVLFLLFMSQRFGTDKVGYAFAPIITLWLLSIAAIGVFNFIKYDPLILKCINPVYIFGYFWRNGKYAWHSLGGCVLCITGVEALFADLGHFTVSSIRVSMCSIVYPALILAYTGQAAYLRKHTDDVADTFYKSIPKPIYWPMFVMALLAAVIASQAMISGTFSIIQQSLALGCFPRVKVVHTSLKYPGQVYIPEANYALMFACIAITAIFKNTTRLSNAYGIAVVCVMVLTSTFLVLVMVILWKTPLPVVVLYCSTVAAVEVVYLTAVFYKLDHGGWISLVIATLIIVITMVWSFVYREKYNYEVRHKMVEEEVVELVSTVGRVPGVAMFYSELAQGVPGMFKGFMTNMPALHSVVVFVSVKSLPVVRVGQGERFVFRRVGPPELMIFRCIARYGYMEVHRDVGLESLLVEGLRNVVAGDEEMMVEQEWRASAVVHVMGDSNVIAKEGSSMWKRLVVNYAYKFLKRNMRQQDEIFTITHSRLLKVGVTVEI